MTLRSAGNFQRCTSGNGRYFNLSPEKGSWKPDNCCTVQIRSLPVKNGMLFDMNYGVEVARGATIFTRFAFAGNSQELTIFNAGRDRYFNSSRFPD
jgi:hypothetical protein